MLQRAVSVDSPPLLLQHRCVDVWSRFLTDSQHVCLLQEDSKVRLLPHVTCSYNPPMYGHVSAVPPHLQPLTFKIRVGGEREENKSLSVPCSWFYCTSINARLFTVSPSVSVLLLFPPWTFWLRCTGSKCRIVHFLSEAAFQEKWCVRVFVCSKYNFQVL